MSAVDGWFEELPEEWHEVAFALRNRLLEASPRMKEEWKYKLPFYSNGRWMCYLSFQKKRLVLGFIEGVHLLDPDALFAPTGHKMIRHFLPGPSPSALNDRALCQLITVAVLYNEELLARRKGRKRKNG